MHNWNKMNLYRIYIPNLSCKLLQLGPRCIIFIYRMHTIMVLLTVKIILSIAGVLCIIYSQKLYLLLDMIFSFKSKHHGTKMISVYATIQRNLKFYKLHELYCCTKRGLVSDSSELWDVFDQVNEICTGFPLQTCEDNGTCSATLHNWGSVSLHKMFTKSQV